MHFQVSVFRFSAWKFNEDRGQFYYHAFTPEQPDLNYRNPRVVEEMKVSLNVVGWTCYLGMYQRYTYGVLQTIQMEPLCAWAESAVLDSTKTALKFKVWDRV